MRDERIIKQAAGREDGCLTEEALERVVSGRASEAERDHADVCAHCGAEVAMMRSFLEAEPTAAEAEVVRRMEKDLRNAPAWRPQAEAPRRSWLFARPIWGLGLAGLAAALVMGVWTSNPVRPVVPEEDVVRSGQIEEIGPAGDLAQAPVTVQWRVVKNAVAYEVRLLDVEEKVLWQTRTAAPTVTLPAEARALMTERKTLSWRISAFDAAGREAAPSAGVRFRVVSR